MSMYPQAIGSIPVETMRVARAAYPKGSLAMRLRDELGELYQDEQFGSLFSSRGQPAAAPWRLAIVLVLQYVEGLTDRQAAEAVRGRIDWKYALGLELSDPGFDASVLSEFRERLVAGQAETLLLEVLLERCKQRGWLKAGGKQRTDSTHVLARVRSLSHGLRNEVALWRSSAPRPLSFTPRAKRGGSWLSGFTVGLAAGCT
jgi:transposase